MQLEKLLEDITTMIDDLYPDQDTFPITVNIIDTFVNVVCEVLHKIDYCYSRIIISYDIASEARIDNKWNHLATPMIVLTSYVNKKMVHTVKSENTFAFKRYGQSLNNVLHLLKPTILSYVGTLINEFALECKLREALGKTGPDEDD